MTRQEDVTLPVGASVDAPDTPPPTLIGDYRLVSILATGGFGVVYRVAHVHRGTPAALKLLYSDFATDPTVILRFEREVDAIRRVRHPNVIEVFERGRLDDGRPYFTMELLEGVSLQAHLDVRGRLLPDEALAILDPLCAALSAAHDQAIVHRDVKASNIFLSDPGPQQRVVLLDFGVAKLLDADGPGLTSSRHTVGTAACMAPEQILGRPVDARTDVYALGVLTYRMLTGEPPFAARTIQAMQQMHLYALPQPPSARAPVNPALSDVVLRALAKDPSARPKGASELLAELVAAAASSPRAADLEERAALAVYVEAFADSEIMDAPDSSLLDDLENILLYAAKELTAAGFRPALETGTSLLVALERPEDPALDAAARRAAAEVVLALNDTLARRPGRDRRIQVRFCLHAGTLRVAEGGAILGGKLLTVAAWVPTLELDVPGDRVLASSAVLAGLDLDTESLAEPSSFVRMNRRGY